MEPTAPGEQCMRKKYNKIRMYLDYGDGEVACGAFRMLPQPPDNPTKWPEYSIDMIADTPSEMPHFPFARQGGTRLEKKNTDFFS